MSYVYDDADWQRIGEVLASGDLDPYGPSVTEFETRFAARHGVAHAVSASSGTSALILALHAAGVLPGDRVVVPSLTFCATGLAVSSVGAVPVLVDSDPATLVLGPAQLAAIPQDPPPAAVVAVDLFGVLADVAALRAALPEQVAVIADSAQAFGSTWDRDDGRDLVTFSFNASKQLPLGQGGMLLAADEAAAETARRHRHHGLVGTPVGWISRSPGGNHLFDGLRAALGLSLLARIDGLLDERRRWAARLDALAGDHPQVSAQTVPRGCDRVPYRWAVRFREQGARDHARTLAASGGLAFGPYQPPLHCHPALADAPVVGDLAVARAFWDDHLVLAPDMRAPDEQAERLAAVLERL